MTANDRPAPGTRDAIPAPPTGFASYLFTQGAWFLAFGLQMVLFPYLVRVLLQENEIRFGLAQMSMQLPTVLLILLGGFVADRTDTRRTVLIGCGLCAATFLGLGVFVAGGRLTYGTLIIYALIIGTIGAFVTPARDALLSRVAPGGVHRAVGFASLAQFGGQILGMAVATAAPLLGLPALLFGQAALMAAAAVAAMRIKPRPAGAPRIREGSVLGFMASEIGGGFRAAIASPVIAPVIICAVGMGMCFMGAFAVLLPLIVQNYFPSDLVGPARTQIATALGIFSLTFWVGSILSATALLRFGHIRRLSGLAVHRCLGPGALQHSDAVLAVVRPELRLGPGGRRGHDAWPQSGPAVCTAGQGGPCAFHLHARHNGRCTGGCRALRRPGSRYRPPRRDPVPGRGHAGDRWRGLGVLAALATG